MTVASKLTACPQCGATLTTDARFCGGCGAAIAETEPTGGSGPSAVDFSGREIAGRYRLLALLGEGGMGAVYRAEQISLKRVVALKLLKSELSADPSLVRRFNAEAEMAAKLNHPNTVTLYDFGQDADGSLFIAMEYIEGRSLRHVMMHEGPLPAPRAVDICAQVCASLGDAHAAGIVHRDLKPDNVMLSTRGRQSDVVRVLDFGIAKLRTQGDMTAMPMTQAGDLLGTPQYMAPEQIRGERVDARTDVYALGAMLYEMITGRLAFEAPTLMAILSKHLTESPMPPRERRADLAISAELSDLVMACMAKDAAERPASMDEVADRLREASARRAATPIPVPSRSAVMPVSGPPSVVSAPPGVPRRLATPTPRSSPAVQPPSHAAAPPMPQGPPTPMPQGPPTPMPPMAQRPAGPPPHVVTARTRAPGGGAWVWAVVALLLVGGAGTAAFFALRGDGKKSAAAANVPATSASTASPADGADGDDDDVPSLADFDVKSSSPEEPPEEPSQQPPQNDPDQPEGGFFDRPHAAAVWQHPIFPFRIHYPAGFLVQNQGAAWVLGGMWEGAPLRITVFALDVGAAQPAAAQRAMVLNLISQAGAVVTHESHRAIAGASRYTGTYEVRGEEKGDFVLYTDGGLMVLVGVGGPPASFARHAAFRRAFFEKAVAVGR